MKKKTNGVLELIREINEREIRHKKLVEARYPQVGIFYVIDGKLISDTTPTREAEDYGEFKSHINDHYKFWNLLKRLVFPKHKGLDYDYFPRGRVVYNKRKDEYSIYVDKCIAGERKLMGQIKRDFYLPYNRVTVDQDYHYQCKKCNPNYVE